MSGSDITHLSYRQQADRRARERLGEATIWLNVRAPDDPANGDTLAQRFARVADHARVLTAAGWRVELDPNGDGDNGYLEVTAEKLGTNVDALIDEARQLGVTGFWLHWSGALNGRGEVERQVEL